MNASENNLVSLIPKIIHCCWFGSQEPSAQMNDCIESWKKYLPDYQIKIWNEHNLDFSECRYAQEAFKLQKWAFLSDYVRLRVLHEEGGIYFDTDVEVLKIFDDFLELPAFIGFESPEALCTAVIGSEKGGRWVDRLINLYKSRRFVDDSGEIDYTTNVKFITEVCVSEFGLNLNGCRQNLDDQVEVYPCETFSPIDFQTGIRSSIDKSYSIHHYMGSWLDKRDHRRIALQRRLARIFGARMGLLISRVVNHMRWRLCRIFRAAGAKTGIDK